MSATRRRVWSHVRRAEAGRRGPVPVSTSQCRGSLRVETRLHRKNKIWLPRILPVQSPSENSTECTPRATPAATVQHHRQGVLNMWWRFEALGVQGVLRNRDKAVANEMVRQLLKSIHVSNSFCSVSNLDKCTRCSARVEAPRRNMRIVCTNHCCIAVSSQQHRKTQREGR